MKQTRIVFILGIVLLLSLSIAFAHEEETFAEGQALVESKVSCDNLTQEQLAAIGEWYMEQMHPGTSHEIMDAMMGLEDNPERDLAFHSSLGEQFYCGQTSNASYTYGMMNGYSYGMMSGFGSMMNWGYGTSSWWLWCILGFIIIAAIIFAVVFWGVYYLIRRKK
ncbi:hypothetical protein HZA98_00880 [Candidatus Woesearchaeota archaeon]|nr:hypothetical protein [Candidatus Woesearchaeota archaeon]